MTQCPCSSGKKYKNCCKPIHLDQSLAKSPEQLMRSRFSAYSLGLVDYIIQSYHPSCNAQEDRDGIQSGCDLSWIKLSIKESGLLSNTEGFVHFKAYYVDGSQNGCLEERSRFLKHKGLWFYVDGMIK